MRYEVTREGDLAPSETTQTYDFALLRAEERSRKQQGSLRWFVWRKDGRASEMLASFRRGVRSDVRVCASCKGESAKPGGWCGACTCVGWTEVRT